MRCPVLFRPKVAFIPLERDSVFTVSPIKERNRGAAMKSLRYSLCRFLAIPVLATIDVHADVLPTGGQASVYGSSAPW
jgi:hypothetical protein